MIEAVRSAENIADDLWPLEGQEDPESKYSTRNTRYEAEPHTAGEYSRKRRKYDAAPELQNESHLSNRSLSTLDGTEWKNVPTTMQNQASFSLPKIGGFMSASVQLKQSLDKRALISNTASKRKDVGLGTGLETKSRISKLSRGQGTLTTCWKHETNPRVECPSAAELTLTNSTKATPLSTATTEARQSAELSTAAKNYGYPNMSLTTPGLVIDDTRTHHPRNPLLTIPQSLANHKLSPAIGCLRSPKSIVEDEASHKHHGFLSSSPPLGEDIKDKASARNTEPVQPHIRSETVSSNVTRSDTCKYGVRPAGTFHNTSMQQVKTMAQTAKKTLGLRRNMVEWSARTGHSHGKLTKERNTS